MHYPFQKTPQTGETIEVSENLHWIRMPLPFRLNHVNIWAMRDADSWSVIDCAIEDDICAKAWRKIDETLFEDLPVTRLLATHGHTDHIGAAGTFCARHDAQFEISMTEWMSARLRFYDHNSPTAQAPGAFLNAHGCTESLAGDFQAERDRVSRHLSPLPSTFRRIRHGETRHLGGRSWRMIATRGHADEHICLFNETDNILIVGDQVLPEITPLIAVFPWMPDDDPLGDYFASLEDLRQLPSDVLVLPGHGRPFVGLHDRIEESRLHHEKRLAAARHFAGTGRTAFDIMQDLFPKAQSGGQGRLALGETLSHLNYLVKTGEMSSTSHDGVTLFARH